MHHPSPALIAKLIEIDADFFGREFQTQWGPKIMAEELFVYPGIGGRRIIEMASRVVVPSEAISRAEAILSDIDNPPQVVSIAELS